MKTQICHLCATLFGAILCLLFLSCDTRPTDGTSFPEPVNTPSITETPDQTPAPDPGHNADLSDLLLNHGVLLSAFNPASLNYNATFWSESLTVSPVAADVNVHEIAVRLNSGAWQTANQHDPQFTLTLIDETNTIEVRVTAEDQTIAKTYSLTALKKRALSALSIVDGPNTSEFTGVAGDSLGNIYAAGRVGNGGIYTYGAGVTSDGYNPSYNAVVVKYNSSGTAEWAGTVTNGYGDTIFSSVGVDSSGNVYAAGWMMGSFSRSFGPLVSTGAAPSSSSSNLVLVKYNSGGTAQWAKTLASDGTSSSQIEDIAVDSSGNVFAAGYVGSNTYTFGPGVEYTGSNTYNAVVIKYDTNGTAQNVMGVTSSTGNTKFYSISLDSSGNVYASGYISNNTSYTFGDNASVSGPYADGENAVVVKFDSAGTGIWARAPVTGNNNSQFKAVAVDSVGNVYGVGTFAGNSSFTFYSGVSADGPGTVENAMIVKYNSTGIAQWARSLSVAADVSGFSDVIVNSFGVFASGSIYSSGIFAFEAGDLNVRGSSSGWNVLLMKYDDQGTALWGESLSSGNGNTYFECLGFTGSNTVLAGGNINSTTTFGFHNNVTAKGDYSSTFAANIVLVLYNGEL